ncbi:pyridine nucleotide-disulfide oxidoreductase [Fragilaria crotonensis]|nr:pyridine nucleotide-disulfide oxidoreductase [Fragilaria crotonensis]
MKYNSILWFLAYMAHFGSAFVPSIVPSRFAVLKSQHQDTKATGFILWQSKKVDSPSLEIVDSPVRAAISKKVHTAQEAPRNGGAQEPEPPLRLKTIQTKRGGKLLAKEKDSAQFYEVSRMGALDTIEDAVLHARRIPYDLGWVLADSKDDAHRKTIVVLGSGWAAHAILKVADTYKLRLIVVSPTNHFVFTPMLASASVGTVEYRSMTEAVRASNPMIESYVEGSATAIDVEKRVITVQLQSLLEDYRHGQPPHLEIPYDHLVVAVGCRVNDNVVPGAAEYCLRLKSCDDARLLRNAVGECLEYASRPDVAVQTNIAEQEQQVRQEERSRRVTFCIVGGGPTGVELAGELTDFVKDITKPRTGVYSKLKNDIKIVLVQGGAELVPQFDPDLRKHGLESLLKQGVEVRLNTRVVEVGDGFIKLQSKVGDQKVETMKVGVTVWAAGTAPVPFISTLLEALPSEARGVGGKVNVDQWLRCPTPTPETYGSIIVVGDAAACKDDEGGYLPQTAQVAGQQGAYVARMLDRDYDLTMTPPLLTDDSPVKSWLLLRGLEKAQGFFFLNLGILAYVGGGQALSQVQLGDMPLAKYAGSVSFILWRSVYLVKQVATRNRVLVTFDWIKSALFGRDITRL